jgi:putative transposase
MPRKARKAPGGYVYHVLNRSAGKMKMLRTEKDYLAMERVMAEAQELHPIKILSYCLMPTHWHFVVYPQEDGQVTSFFRWLAHTHAMRWRVAHRTVGYGHLYQGRFKSFVIQRDEHLLSVLRYVERNALSAGLVERAEDWRWGSLWKRENEGANGAVKLLSDWPVDRPRDWVQQVNRAMTEKELERIRLSVRRDRPLGSEAWVAKTVKQLHLEHTVRAEGRPRIEKET